MLRLRMTHTSKNASKRRLNCWYTWPCVCRRGREGRDEEDAGARAEVHCCCAPLFAPRRVQALDGGDTTAGGFSFRCVILTREAEILSSKVA